MVPVPALLQPEHLYERADVRAKPCPVPAEPGIYAWYFRELPDSRIQRDHLHHAHGLTLLYVGISPKAPPLSGGKPSSENLRKRIRYHYEGNAEGSTLRLTLGCLLSSCLGTALRRVGSGKRLTFGSGETTLTDWMAENALVTWIATPAPWEVEAQLLDELDLPLNLDQNSGNHFYPTLREVRKDAREKARALPIINPPSAALPDRPASSD